MVRGFVIRPFRCRQFFVVVSHQRLAFPDPFYGPFRQALPAFDEGGAVPCYRRAVMALQSDIKSNSFRISLSTACSALSSSGVRSESGRHEIKVCAQVSSGSFALVALTYT